MGLTHVHITVKETHKSKKSAEVKFLVDSGAVYSLVPSDVLKRLGCESHRESKFILADGTEIRRRVGDAYFEYKKVGGAAPVIFGEPGDDPLLGATALEALELVLDPFRRELRPMTMPLMGAVRVRRG